MQCQNKVLKDETERQTKLRIETENALNQVKENFRLVLNNCKKLGKKGEEKDGLIEKLKEELGELRKLNVKPTLYEITFDQSMSFWLEKKAPSTQKNYLPRANDLVNFLKSSPRKVTKPTELKLQHLNDYKSVLVNCGIYSDDTIESKLQTVKSLCTWLYKNKVTSTNIGTELNWRVV